MTWLLYIGWLGLRVCDPSGLCTSSGGEPLPIEGRRVVDLPPPNYVERRLGTP